MGGRFALRHELPWHEELGLLLRPPGQGIYLVSTGREEQAALSRAWMGVATDAELDERFHGALEAAASADVVLLGIPSDVGAGFRRGANLGPMAIRQELLRQVPDWSERAARAKVVDLGDVFVVPQLLTDDMLNPAQRQATQAALYPQVPLKQRRTLPVAPLTAAERVLDLVLERNPSVRVVALGGDHSTAWPVVSALGKARKDRWAIVQIDAHTDLLPERLGIKMCFATWSYHANEFFRRDGRLVQLGIRATRYDRGHWERTLGVQQYWAKDCVLDPDGTIDAVVAHLKRVGAQSIYFSNDIDGTDESFADATGTPEGGGLMPEFVMALIERLGREFPWIGADLMEVAPPLGSSLTVETGVSYLRASLHQILGRPL